jgi:hypothetical protein
MKSHKRKKARRSLLNEYWKHTALNLGQLVRDFRFFYYHPASDRIAREGTAKHYAASFVHRLRSMGNNAFYAIVPPHWHHTAEDLRSMSSVQTHKWFLHGYAPWRFSDPRKGNTKNGAFTT